MQVRQIDVWEPYGLLVMLIDKGRICIFKLNELSQLLNESTEQARNKNHCREHRLEFIQSCNVYCIKKQPINHNECFKIIASCGRKLVVIESNLVSMICDQCIIATNPITELSSLNLNSPSVIMDSSSSPNLAEHLNDMTNLFHVKKEIFLSEVPQFVNIIESVTDDNYSQYILVSYKTKCELISEKTGDLLRQLSFGQMSTIRSIVELYDNDKIELLITHNSSSEFIKIDQRALESSNLNNTKSYLNFQWNIIPTKVFIIFPYAIAFSVQCIEIRLLVNGNLVNSITLPNIKFITSKKEIFFSAELKSFHNDLENKYNAIAMNHIPNLADDNSPPQSPIDSKQSTVRETCTIYKINLDFLNQSNMKTSDKFIFNQLCEDSSRTIQRDVSNLTSQFIFNDNDEMARQYSVYQRIINSNVIIKPVLILRKNRLSQHQTK